MAEENLYSISLRKIMSICARREFCSNDIRQKLESWGLSENDIKKIIEILIKERFIDEERYAMAFVKDKFRYHKWGKIKLSAALRLKKIPDNKITLALETIDNGSYVNEIRNLLASHRKTIKAKNLYDLKGKLLRFGLSKGYESQILYDLLNDLV